MSVLRRLVPASLRARVRQLWYRVRPPRMQAGLGRGLRFDPGPSNPDYARGDNELPVQQALATSIHPGDTVFDIGANVGFLTIIAAHLTGAGGRVIAFEPVPANAALVRRNAALNRLTNVDVVERAVSDHSGRGELLLAAYSGGAALTTAGRPPDVSGAMDVELVSIDDAVARDGVRPPNVVKIDVEGAELEVLRGMVATIREHRPIIVCEIDDGDRDRYATKYAACADFVRQLGYQVVELEGSYAGNEWIVGHFVATPGAAG